MHMRMHAHLQVYIEFILDGMGLDLDLQLVPGPVIIFYN
jgi:hypothetical protein